MDKHIKQKKKKNLKRKLRPSDSAIDKGGVYNHAKTVCEFIE